MIKLKIKILSFFCENDHKTKIAKFNATDEYDEEWTYKELLEYLYRKYGIYNDYRRREKYCVWDYNDYFWSDYLQKQYIIYIQNELDDYLDKKIINLERQFKISKRMMEVHLNPPGMGGCIGEKENIKFFIHSNEKDRHAHNPHVHCIYNNQEISIYIKDLKVIGKPFDNKKMKIAKEVIKENREGLLNYWQNFVVNGINVDFKLEV